MASRRRLDRKDNRLDLVEEDNGDKLMKMDNMGELIETSIEKRRVKSFGRSRVPMAFGVAITGCNRD